MGRIGTENGGRKRYCLTQRRLDSIARPGLMKAGGSGKLPTYGLQFSIFPLSSFFPAIFHWDFLRFRVRLESPGVDILPTKTEFLNMCSGGA
jgi:hypothetical protein